MATDNKENTKAVKYFEGQHKSKKLCCYFPDTMRLYDEHKNGKYYRIIYCKNHKKIFRIRINPDSFCLEDGAGSIENFDRVWKKEMDRLKQLKKK